MSEMLGAFVRALRASGVPVSTAESIDAARTLETVGIGERELLRSALGQVLAKTVDDKAVFEHCFDTFFALESPTVAPAAASSAELDAAPPEAADDSPAADSGTNLSSLLESGDRSALQQQMAQAAGAVQLQNIRLFTQRGLYGRRILEQMGIEQVDEHVAALAREDPDDPRLERLRAARAALQEDVSGLVDRSLLLYTANAGQQLREEILYQTPLSRVETRDLRTMQLLVRKLARKLVSLHARRRRRAQRGQLDVRRTIRRNIEYDGIMFYTAWKRVRVERPKVVAVCDVSGSVAQVSRFLLMFLYSVTDVIPKVRAFAFSSRLGEVTDVFARAPADEAVAATLKHWGGGSTDYGGALAELDRLAGKDIDHRTTVLILGDARSNHGDPGHRVLRRIHDRARRVLWLNPEPRSLWNTGDSEMQRLGASCDRVESCRSIRHLERIVAEIARSAV